MALLGWAFLLLVASITASLALVTYRLVLSPLAGVPGPKIAAATAWYEFYWDCAQQGRFLFKIQDMHRRYGSAQIA
jgi:hypothetical protein